MSVKVIEQEYAWTFPGHGTEYAETVYATRLTDADKNVYNWVVYGVGSNGSGLQVGDIDEARALRALLGKIVESYQDTDSNS